MHPCGMLSREGRDDFGRRTESALILPEEGPPPCDLRLGWDGASWPRARWREPLESRPRQACPPRGLRGLSTGWEHHSGGPVSGPPRPLRSSPPPQQGPIPLMREEARSSRGGWPTSGRARTSCATPSRRTWWRAARTYGPCRGTPGARSKNTRFMETINSAAALRHAPSTMAVRACWPTPERASLDPQHHA